MLFWQELRKQFSSLCRWVVAHALGVTVSGIAIVLGGIVSYFSPDISEWAWPPRGQIIVNSPTIYTRQRLVNDRLSQVRWLEDQLQAADQPTLTNFNSIDQVTHISSTENTKIAGTLGHESTQETPSSTAKGAQAPSSDTSKSTADAMVGSVSVQPTTTALFRAKDAFREEVRGEMTETELDDRHDILGNTIYRLSFTASVVAGDRVSASAGIQIKLSHRPLALFVSQVADSLERTLTRRQIIEKESDRKTLSQLYERDYEELYDDWIRYWQKQISISIDSVAKSLATQTPEAHIKLLFSKFLLGRLCEFDRGTPITLDDYPSCDTPKATDTKGTKTADPNTDAAAAMADNKNEALIRARGELATFISNYFAWTEEQSRSKFFADLKKIKQKTFRGQPIFDLKLVDLKDDEFQQIYISARRQCQNNSLDQAAVSTLGIKLVDVVTPGNLSGPAANDPSDMQDPRLAIFQTTIIGCPFYETAAEYMRAGILYYMIRFNGTTRNPSEAEQKSSEMTGLNQSSSEKSTAQQKPNSKEMPLPNEYTLSSKFCPNVDVVPSSRCVDPAYAFRCFAADFIKANLNGFAIEKRQPQQALSHFANLELTGREAGNCDILFSKLTPEYIKDPKDPSGRSYTAVDDLEYYLNAETETFAYSVTPKNLSENISTAAETRDSFEMLLRAAADEKKFAAGAIDRLESLTKSNEAILAHAIVVGFGSDGEPPVLVKRDENALIPRDQTTAVRSTDFGWIIAPRLLTDGKFDQVDGQYALTAVISVPSWWRSVELEINTCWITPKTLSKITMDNGKQLRVCPAKSPSPDPTVVRLPGAISELSRKLGFEVVQEPYLIGNDVPSTLDVGQPGALLLKGGRLWRSTEVTLGAQKATSIVVLPNMEGIIAKFDCVLPPTVTSATSTPVAPDQVTTDVIVWTSEGKTNPVPVNLRWPKEPPPPAGPWRGVDLTAPGASSSAQEDRPIWCGPKNSYLTSSSYPNVTSGK